MDVFNEGSETLRVEKEREESKAAKGDIQVNQRLQSAAAALIGSFNLQQYIRSAAFIRSSTTSNSTVYLIKCGKFLPFALSADFNQCNFGRLGVAIADPIAFNGLSNGKSAFFGKLGVSDLTPVFRVSSVGI
jgi:hypothetical protein